MRDCGARGERGVVIGLREIGAGSEGLELVIANVWYWYALSGLVISAGRYTRAVGPGYLKSPRWG